MKKIFIQVTILLSAFCFLKEILTLLFYDPGNIYAGLFYGNLLMYVDVLLILYCCFKVHKNYKQQQGGLSWKMAYLSGFGIITLSYLINFVVASLFFQLFWKNKLFAQEGIAGLITLFSGPHQPNLIPPFLYYLLQLELKAFLIDLKFLLMSPVVVGLILLVWLEANYMIFRKAAKNPWYALVPFYRTIVLLEIIGKPKWWFVMLFIPLVNIYFYILILDALSARFERTKGFTAGLFFLPFIYFPKLGFTRAVYKPGATS